MKFQSEQNLIFLWYLFHISLFLNVIIWCRGWTSLMKNLFHWRINIQWVWLKYIFVYLLSFILCILYFIFYLLSFIFVFLKFALSLLENIHQKNFMDDFSMIASQWLNFIKDTYLLKTIIFIYSFTYQIFNCSIKLFSETFYFYWFAQIWIKIILNIFVKKNHLFDILNNH
jgi:hypothetical protein